MLHGRQGEVVIPAQSIYEQSVTAKHQVGSLLRLGTRAFRYCRAGGVALTKSLMTSAPAIVANHKDVVQTAYGWTAGQRIVNVLLTGTDPTLDQYKDGFVIVNKGTGLGQAYKIKSHSLADDPMVATLYDEVVTTVPATSEMSLIPPRWRAVVVFPTTAIGPPTGVPLIDVTKEYYFWAQILGLAPLVVDTGETLVAGEHAGFPGTPAIAGTVGTPTAGSGSVWGVVHWISTPAEVAGVFLNGLGGL